MKNKPLFKAHFHTQQKHILKQTHTQTDQERSEQVVSSARDRHRWSIQIPVVAEEEEVCRVYGESGGRWENGGEEGDEGVGHR